MLTLQQINDLVNNHQTVSDQISRWRSVYYAISLHTTGAQPRYKDVKDDTWITPKGYYSEEYQKLFERFLLNQHPRESVITKWWRFSQYRPITKAPFQQIIEIIGATIFQDSNFTIDLGNKADHEYIWSNAFNTYDIIQYFEWALQHIIEDPNGFFVRIPKQPYNATTTAAIEPDIWFIPSKNIYSYGPDLLVFDYSDYRWAINTVGIFRYVQENGKWVLADDGGYYAHGLDRLPCDQAGGKWNTQGFYDSWLDKAVPTADEIIAAKSAEMLVDKEASHPYIIMASEDCPSCDNSTGYIQVEDDDAEGGYRLEKCKKCKGRGYISNNPGERLHVPAEQMDKDMVKIVNPDVEINKHHFEKGKELRMQLLDALHLTKAQESQSGVAKAIDQERLYEFISLVSSDVFGRIIFNSIRDIIGYRNVSVQNDQIKPNEYKFTFIKPSQFQIKTAADLLEDYDSAVKASVPGYVRGQLMKEYVDKQFGGDYQMQKKTDVIIYLDYLCAYTTEEKQSMALTGEADRRDLQFSARLPNMLDMLSKSKGSEWFLQATYDNIKTEIDIIFEKIAPVAAPPKLPLNGGQ